MKIYTRTGDAGDTSLIGGARVSKGDMQIEAYGTIDELNSYLGLLRDHKEMKDYSKTIVGIQENLFSIGSLLAVEQGKSFDYIPEIAEADIKELEEQIDKMDLELPEMKNFVLPGGHPLVSYCHIARCICRRAERRVISMQEHMSVADHIVIFLNRLSDFLFTLSRKIALDLGAEQIPWKPRK